MLGRLRGKLLVMQRRKAEAQEKLEALDAKMKEIQQQGQQIQAEGQKLMGLYGKIEGGIALLNEMIKDAQDEPDTEEVPASAD